MDTKNDIVDRAYSDDITHYTPLHDRVVVREIKPPSVTSGGLYLSAEATEKAVSVRGEVLAVGPGAHGPLGEWVPTKVKPGQIVVYGKYAGTDLEVGKDKIRVLRELDIYVVIEE